jgi:GT2 family glycosyltransferase
MGMTPTAPLVPPAAVRVIDLGRPLEDLVLWRPDAQQPYRSLLVMARIGEQPIGVATFSLENTTRIERARLRAGIDAQLGSALSAATRRLTSCASPSPRPTAPGDDVPGLARMPPLVSVVVVTCGSVTALERCVRSVLRSDYDALEIVVVDNRPQRPGTGQMLALQFRHERRLRYVDEPRRGASYARNAGLCNARGDVVAFVDDDVVVDPGWMRANVDALTRGGGAACCTGLILPLELETESQILLEQFAAFGKGFSAKRYRLPEARAQDPLLPYTVGSIGSGASMAFLARIARELGGFDTALGPGTPATGAEDLDILLRVLRAGQTVAYEPRALVWHQHPDGISRLRRQAYRYGIGLGAMLTKHLLVGPQRRDLVRATPSGVRYALRPTSRKNAGKPAGFPRQLTWLERAGILAGPVAYVLSVASRARRRRSGGHDTTRFDGALGLGGRVAHT